MADLYNFEHCCGVKYITRADGDNVTELKSDIRLKLSLIDNGKLVLYAASSSQTHHHTALKGLGFTALAEFTNPITNRTITLYGRIVGPKTASNATVRLAAKPALVHVKKPR